MSATTTEAGAYLADEIGHTQPSMGCSRRASRSRHPRYATMWTTWPTSSTGSPFWRERVGGALRHGTQGRAGSEALTAAAHVVRASNRNHPGRYAAANCAEPAGSDDELTRATNELLGSLSAVLRGYQPDPTKSFTH